MMPEPFKTHKVDKASGLGQALFYMCSQDDAAEGTVRRLYEGGGRSGAFMGTEHLDI